MRIIDTTWIKTKEDAEKAKRFAEQVLMRVPSESGETIVPREAVYWFMPGQMPEALDRLEGKLPGEPHKSATLYCMLDEMIEGLKSFAKMSNLEPIDRFPGSVLVLTREKPEALAKRGAMALRPEAVP